MKDCTNLFNRYREACRFLWNTAFWPDPMLRDYLGFGLYREVTARLFEGIVVLALGYQGRVEPQGSPGDILEFDVSVRAETLRCFVNLSDNVGYKVWEEVEFVLKAGTYRFAFIDYFDWELLAVREYRYVEVFIKTYDGFSKYEGRRALIDAGECSMSLAVDMETVRCTP